MPFLYRFSMLSTMLALLPGAVKIGHEQSFVPYQCQHKFN